MNMPQFVALLHLVIERVLESFKYYNSQVLRIVLCTNAFTLQLMVRSHCQCHGVVSGAFGK